MALLTLAAVAACVPGHIQSQEPYREAPGMSVDVLRTVEVLDAPVSGEVVASIEAGRDLTVLCFFPARGQQSDHPTTVRVSGPEDGYVTVPPSTMSSA